MATVRFEGTRDPDGQGKAAIQRYDGLDLSHLNLPPSPPQTAVQPAAGSPGTHPGNKKQKEAKAKLDKYINDGEDYAQAHRSFQLDLTKQDHRIKFGLDHPDPTKLQPGVQASQRFWRYITRSNPFEDPTKWSDEEQEKTYRQLLTRDHFLESRDRGVLDGRNEATCETHHNATMEWETEHWTGSHLDPTMSFCQDQTPLASYKEDGPKDSPRLKMLLAFGPIDEAAPPFNPEMHLNPKSDGLLGLTRPPMSKDFLDLLTSVQIEGKHACFLVAKNIFPPEKIVEYKKTPDPKDGLNAGPMAWAVAGFQLMRASHVNSGALFRFLDFFWHRAGFGEEEAWIKHLLSTVMLYRTDMRQFELSFCMTCDLHAESQIHNQYRVKLLAGELTKTAVYTVWLLERRHKCIIAKYRKHWDSCLEAAREYAENKTNEQYEAGKAGQLPFETFDIEMEMDAEEAEEWTMEDAEIEEAEYSESD